MATRGAGVASTRSNKKRSNSVANVEAIGSRADRKRVQNRISQQCVREKRAAKTKHLELLADVLQAGDGKQGKSREALVNAQLEMLRENEELKEALLRLRKKFLSLSTAAAAAACK